jgi:beta-lactamase regulating signal transducer with metallopeptidase domain
MNTPLLSLFQAVITASWQATVLAALIGLLRFFLGSRLSPAWRHALWSLVLIRLIVPVFPESSYSIFNAPRWFQASPVEPTVTVTDPGPVPLSSLPVRIEASDPVAPLRPTSPRLDLLTVAAAVWALVSGLLLLRLGAGHFWLRRRLARHSRPVASHAVHALSETRVRLRTLQNPRLLETAAIDSPGLSGCIRPRLLLPAGLIERLSPGEIRHVFAHELAHLRRGDLWINLLALIAQCLHWFNPIAWLVFRQLRLERELACDALVLHGKSPEERQAYGATLLKLLDRLQPRPFPAVVGIVEEKQSAASRLRQITDPAAGGRHSRALGLLLVVLAALTGLSNAETPGDKPIDLQPLPAPAPPAAGLEILKDQYVQEAAKLDQLRQRLNALAAQLGLSPETQRAPDSTRVEAEQSYQRQTTLLAHLKKLPAADLRRVLPAVLPDPLLDSLLQAFAEAEQRYAADRLELGERHPKMDRLRILMETINRQIEERVAGILAGLEIRIAQAKAVLDAHTNPPAPARSEEPEARRTEPEAFFALKREVETQQRIVDTLYMRLLAEKVDAQIPQAQRAGSPETLIADARFLMEMGRLAEAENKLRAALAEEPGNRAAAYYLQLVRERKADRSAQPASSPGRTRLLQKHESILLPVWRVPRGTRFSDAVAELDRLARTHDPEREGVNFHIAEADLETRGAAAIAPTAEPPLHRDISLADVTLSEAIRELVVAMRDGNAPPSAARLIYAVEDYATVFRQAPPAAPLYTRTFRVDPAPIAFHLRAFSGREVSNDNLLAELIHYLAQQGAEFAPPPISDQKQKAIFLNDQTRILYVRATLADLDKVETALQTLQSPIPQVQITVSILEIATGAAYEQEILLRSLATNRANAPATLSGILTDPQFQNVLEALDSRAPAPSAHNPTPTYGVIAEADYRRLFSQLRAKAVTFHAPKITTLSHRRARVSIDPGPTIDLLPELQTDQRTFHLTAAAEVPADEKRKIGPTSVWVNSPVPNGDTLIILAPETADLSRVILLTPLLIDAAGNRQFP